MYSVTLVFTQVMDFMSLKTFQRCVERYRGNFGVKNFTCLDQLRTVAFAQLTYRESLRDIEACLRAQSKKLYHMRIRSKVSRSTLAEANETRDWHIYADFVHYLIGIARKLYQKEPLAVELKNTVYALDATTIDLTKIPKDLRYSFKIKEFYVAAVCDDCTRLTYAEIVKDKKASTMTYFWTRSLPWFKQIYNFEFASLMSDNGPEFRGTLVREHPFETMCQELGIKHIYTKPYRPQINGKIEAFWKIMKNELLYPNTFDTQNDLIINLGNFLFDFNHLQRHGGLNYETPFDKLQKVTKLLS
jgi:Integrase core domain.